MERLTRWIERDPAKARLVIKFLVAAAALFATYLYLLSPEGFLARRRLTLEIRSAREEGVRLAQTRAKVLGEIRDLGEDPEAMERIARDELGYERPGETTLDPNL